MKSAILYYCHFHCIGESVDLDVLGVWNFDDCDHQNLEEIVNIINQNRIIDIIQFIGDKWGINKITCVGNVILTRLCY